MIVTVLILLTLAIVCVVLFFATCVRYQTSEPNEWMIVLRNGVTYHCGVGISCYTMLGDKVVKFPSKINKVKFSA